jgi:hypothetical protein
MKKLLVGVILGSLLTGIILVLYSDKKARPTIESVPDLENIVNTEEYLEDLSFDNDYLRGIFCSETTKEGKVIYLDETECILPSIRRAKPHNFTSYYQTRGMLTELSFSNERIDIQAHSVSKEELLRDVPESSMIESAIKEEFENIGEVLAGYYNGKGLARLHSESFDVDNDGEGETVMYYTEIGVMTGYPLGIDIIKDNQVIFTARSSQHSLQGTSSHNGFYLVNQMFYPAFSSPGYYRIRFVYENGEFQPIWEQEVYYPEREDIKKND